MEDVLILCRRKLHECAEIGFELKNTRRIIEQMLESEGVEYKPIGKGSIVARIGRGEYGILLRADSDALPIREETDLSFSSKNGCMHACGHDMHTAMLLGAICSLAKNREALGYEVRFLFQAAEEKLQGAEDAILSGVLGEWDDICTENDEKCKQLFENNKRFFIKKAFSVHCMTGVPMNVGSIVVANGGTSAPASIMFSLSVEGENAHGGAPQMGKDALCAVVSLYNALQTLPQSTVSITDQPLLTIGQLQAGTAPNVICSKAEMSGTIRAMSDSAENRLSERMKEMTENISHAFGVKGELHFLGSAPTLYNDPNLSKEVYSLLCSVLDSSQILYASDLYGEDGQKKNGGSEDFAHFSHLVPSLLLAICAGDSREGYVHPLHHPKTCFDERALMYGARVYEALARMGKEKKDG